MGYNSDVITINTISDTDDGYTLEAGDIVTIELRPATLKHEACFRADSLLAIAPSSATATRLFFQAAEGTENDDVVTFTHADDDGLAFRRISNYFASVLSGQAANKDGFIVVADRANGVVAPELLEAGITKMIVQVQD